MWYAGRFDYFGRPAFNNGENELKMSMLSIADRVATALISSATLAFSAEDRSVERSDLVDPSAQVFDDSYRALSPEQFDDVLYVVRPRGRLQQDRSSEEERQNWQMLLTEIEDALANDELKSAGCSISARL
jgi:hypothetical protein